MPEFSAVGSFKDAAYTIGQTLWPAASGVQVAFGHPGPTKLNDIVAFMDVSGQQDPATYGTSRSREESLELTVVYLVFRAGGPEMEKVAFDRALELQSQFETYIRVTDITVGGSVRECALTSIRVQSDTDEDNLAMGRVVSVEAIYSAKARVRAA